MVSEFLLNEELLIEHLTYGRYSQERSLHEDRIQEYERVLERLDRKVRKLIAAYLEDETDVFHEARDAIKAQRDHTRQRLQESKEAVKNLKVLDSQLYSVRQAIPQLSEKGGFSTLSCEDQRSIVHSLIDEILVNTHEGWFEVRGVLRSTYQLDDGTTAEAPQQPVGQFVETYNYRSKDKLSSGVPFRMCFYIAPEQPLFKAMAIG